MNAGKVIGLVLLLTLTLPASAGLNYFGGCATVSDPGSPHADLRREAEFLKKLLADFKKDGDQIVVSGTSTYSYVLYKKLTCNHWPCKGESRIEGEYVPSKQISKPVLLSEMIESVRKKVRARGEKVRAPIGYIESWETYLDRILGHGRFEGTGITSEKDTDVTTSRLSCG